MNRRKRESANRRNHHFFFYCLVHTYPKGRKFLPPFYCSWFRVFYGSRCLHEKRKELIDE